MKVLYLLIFSIQFISACLICANDQVKKNGYKVVRKIPHDSSAFTQGLSVDREWIYESTGLYGRSSLRKIDRVNGKIVQMLPLSGKIFGEGIVLFKNQVFQMTWRNGEIHCYNKDSLEHTKVLFFPYECWGSCMGEGSVWISHGGSYLTKWDPENWILLDRLEITEKGVNLLNLNDLEWVEGYLYANIWMTDRIVQIDPTTGCVVGEIDCAPLAISGKTSSHKEAVLNGIAFCPRTRTLFVTGKYWDWIFELLLL